MHTLLASKGNELADEHYNQLIIASHREFGFQIPAKSELYDRLYFLLIELRTGKIYSSGYLKSIQATISNQQNFSFLNIGGVIADEKGKGYGKQIVHAIREYLITHDTIGLGFCFPYYQDFYQKRGFVVETKFTHRIIYRNGEEELTAGNQYIVYQDSRDCVLKQILAQEKWEICVPDPTIW